MVERDDRIRIVQMMFSKQPGGAETFFEKLSLGFADAGISQCLIMEPNSERAALFHDYPHVDVVQIGFGGLREWFARRRLNRAFREFSPDIALTWMNRASRRVPSGFCPVVGRLGGYYNLKHYRDCDHLIGITPDLVNHITSSHWKEENVSLIPNFGETSKLIEEEHNVSSLREELGIPSSDTVLLALGRLHRVKAHDVLIEAMSAVEGTTLLLAGDGPLLGPLTKQVVDLGLEGRVHFLGWRRDVARLFKACDISVFPSRYEPNGTVVMESWAHRKPLIASRAKGPEWLVDDEKNGLLFEIDNAEQLARQIERIKFDLSLRDRIVAGGLEKWKQAFSRDAVVARYLKLFARLRTDS